jgi:UDP-galactose transporter B1
MNSIELTERGESDVVPLLAYAEGGGGAGRHSRSSSDGSNSATANLPSSPLPPTIDSPGNTKVQALQLLFGAGGIYASFLYYGSLQEDVFRYVSPTDGSKFTMAWYLQVLESLANVIFGTVALVIMGLTGAGYELKDDVGDNNCGISEGFNNSNSTTNRKWWGGTPNLPKRPFVASGLSQVCSKAFTSLALANGLSFPVATLAKSGKMAPVMIGSLILGGASYGLRDYLQVLAIIAGTAVLSMGKNKSDSSSSSTLGVAFILLSLIMDGITGGVQKRLLAEMKRSNIKLQPYDMLTFTNLFMMIFALLISTVLGEFTQGITYCSHNPEVFALIWKFSLCSAIGQSFIFYTVARFDPLVCSTVTTTRKIFSVLISILFKGHSIPAQGWMGLAMAIGGILSEVSHKVPHGKVKR